MNSYRSSLIHRFNIHMPQAVQITNPITQSRLQHQKIKISSASIKNDEKISISSKSECLGHFKWVSEKFYEDLEKANSALAEYQQRSLKIRLQLHEPIITVQKRYASSSEVNSIMTYVDENLDAFSVKEKAVLFKILSLMHCNRNKSVPTTSNEATLDKLERDFYEIGGGNLSDTSPTEVSFVDLINYRDGFYYHR